MVYDTLFTIALVVLAFFLGREYGKEETHKLYTKKHKTKESKEDCNDQNH